MGWLFTSKSRDQLLRSLIADQETERMKAEVLDHQLAGEVLWSLVRVTAKEDGVLDLRTGESIAYIRCDLLQGSMDGWGYKSMDETVHPYYFSCPLRFLDAAPVQSAEWRKSVRAFHGLADLGNRLVPAGKS